MSKNKIKSESETNGNHRKGFASMDKALVKAIASKGGKAAHAKGTAYEFDTETAKEAGRKGGITTSQDREYMAFLGRKGGKASAKARQLRSQGEGKTRENNDTGLGVDSEEGK